MILFEFFSGIGGMYQSLRNIDENLIQKVFAFDINHNANKVYQYNFKQKPYEQIIESFSLENYENICMKENLNNNLIWTLSPPCQPFTRQGLQDDLEDNRCNGLSHLIDILSNTKFIPNYFFLENFSEAWKLVINILISKGFKIKQFLLSPIQIGIPNSRLRYYLLAKGPNILNIDFDLNNTKISENLNYLIENNLKILNNELKNDDNEILLKENSFDINSIEKDSKILLENNLICDIKPKILFEFLGDQNFNDIEYQKNIFKNFYLSDKLLEKESSYVIDLVNFKSYNTNCFTKSYSRLLKGTGSILVIDENIPLTENIPLKKLKGKVRFFTPDEICKFMCFSKYFYFPDDISIKSRYKLLGNSINVEVVTVLVKFMFFKKF